MQWATESYQATCECNSELVDTKTLYSLHGAPPIQWSAWLWTTFSASHIAACDM